MEAEIEQKTGRKTRKRARWRDKRHNNQKPEAVESSYTENMQKMKRKWHKYRVVRQRKRAKKQRQ